MSASEAATKTDLFEPGRALAVALGLSFTAGFVDTSGFIALFGLFTAHVTGNIVVIGADLVDRSHGIVTKLLALPTFVIVVAATRLLVARYEVDGREAVRTLLMVQAVLLACFMAAGLAISPPESPDALPVMATGLLGVAAMAVQNAKARLLLSAYTPTTVMTGNLTQLVIDGVDLLRRVPPEMRATAKARIIKVAPAAFGFAVGAVSAALIYASIGFACLAIPVVILLVLAVTIRSR